MLTGIHILLTYQCTQECEHCFLHCTPAREGTFTLEQLRRLVREIRRIETVDTVYFEGGEAFLFYPILLEGLQMVRAAGLQAGLVTNAFWATSPGDAVHWLRPIRDIGVVDLSVSDDEFHRRDRYDRRAEFACQAARQLGIPCGTICIKPPSVTVPGQPESHKGAPVIGGGVLFKGRAAEELTAGLPVRPRRELTTCPHEELLNPERVHVDVYGNVHLCQGLSVGNLWVTPLADLMRRYDGAKHPIAGPLIRGGPAQLVQDFGLNLEFAVDECHLCYTARKMMLDRFPEYLAPREVYGC